MADEADEVAVKPEEKLRAFDHVARLPAMAGRERRQPRLHHLPGRQAVPARASGPTAACRCSSAPSRAAWASASAPTGAASRSPRTTRSTASTTSCPPGQADTSGYRRRLCAARRLGDRRSRRPRRRLRRGRAAGLRQHPVLLPRHGQRRPQLPAALAAALHLAARRRGPLPPQRHGDGGRRAALRHRGRRAPTWPTAGATGARDGGVVIDVDERRDRRRRASPCRIRRGCTTAGCGCSIGRRRVRLRRPRRRAGSSRSPSARAMPAASPSPAAMPWSACRWRARTGPSPAWRSTRRSRRATPSRAAASRSIDLATGDMTALGADQGRRARAVRRRLPARRPPPLGDRLQDRRGQADHLDRRVKARPAAIVLRRSRSRCEMHIYFNVTFPGSGCQSLLTRTSLLTCSEIRESRVLTHRENITRTRLRSQGSLIADEIGAGEHSPGGDRGEQDRGRAADAVGVVADLAGGAVVEDAVVGIDGGGAEPEGGGTDRAGGGDAGEDEPVEPDGVVGRGTKSVMVSTLTAALSAASK